MVEVKVNESKRKIVFMDKTVKYFNNVKWFDPDGSWLRIGCDEGYVLLNPDNIKYMIIPEEAKVR